MDVYRYPENTFVATFIGSPAMNMMSARIENGCILGSAVSIPCDGLVGKFFDLARADSCIIGIRPEDFTVSDSGVKPEDSIELKGVVELVETTGSEMLVHFVSGGVPMVARMPSDSKIPLSGELRLDFCLRKIHIFDGNTDISLRRHS